MSEKHAYLIIAHNKWEQLQMLVSQLDDPQNDICIHVDAKSDISTLHLKTLYSKIVFTKRIDVHWGNVSQIATELCLFEEASNTYHSYYHLISGIDLPLHSQDYIHEYLDGKNLEYIGFSPCWNVRERVFCHNLFMRQMRHPNRYVRGVLNKIRLFSNKLQILVGYRKKQPDFVFQAGCNWASVTHDFALALLAKKNEILQMYKYSYCPDEIYKQTFAYNSEFRNRIYDMDNEFEGCLREIDWKRGRPYVWHKEDYEYLSKSKRIFARKFDEKVDKDIINMLINKIKNESNT